MAVLLGLIVLDSCRGKDNLFVNPNYPTKGTAATQLTEVEVATINSFEGDINRTGMVYVQHAVGTDVGSGADINQYALTQLEEDNNWEQLYATLNNANQLRINFGSARPYYDGITEILMVMNIGLLTDNWGDIPYSEALKADANLYPHFDAQQVIYSGMQSMLDDAIVKLSKSDSSNSELPTGDLIYGGDPAQWTKAAYTLKARYLNRLSNKPGYDKPTVLTDLSKGLGSSADDAMGPHDASNGQNQWYAYENARTNYILASQSFIDSISKRPSDQRLYYYFDSTGGVNKVHGIKGSPISPTTPNASEWGSYLVGGTPKSVGDPTQATPLITFMESKFIEAEVRVRNSDATAFQALNMAIMESAKKVTSGAYDGASIATYTAGTASIDRVMYEKWIAMYGQTEAWNDYRRTKLPVLKPNPDGAVSVIPERLPMSQQERNTNPNTISLPITTPVWWAQ